MGRNPSGNYIIPPGTYGAENTTIESAKYNAFVDDIALDLNTPRPILHGGTAATNAAQALVNMAGERAAMLVVDFEAHLWTSGSFYCSNATGQKAPVDGHAFTGICYSSDPPAIPPANLNVVVEARDMNDSTYPGKLYIRQKKAGVWDAGGWKLDGRYIAGTTEGFAGETADMFFGVTGTTPNSAFIVNSESDATGTNILQIARNGLTIIKALGATGAQLYLDAAAGMGNFIFGRANSLVRWAICMGDGTAEGGGNAGNNFTINRYDNAGAFLGSPFYINRASGIVTANGGNVATETYVNNYVASFKPFQAGTLMVFHMNAAPLGWSRNLSYDGRALRINSTGNMGAGGSHWLHSISLNTGDTTLSAWATPGGLSTYGENTFTVYPGNDSGNYMPIAPGGWGGSGPVGGGGVAYDSAHNFTSQTNVSQGYNGYSASGGGSGGWHSHPINFSILYLDVMLGSRD